MGTHTKKHLLNNNKVHIFLTGELRFQSDIHYNDFTQKIFKHNVYISTNARYEYIAKRLTDNYIIVPDSHQEQLRTMYQWNHLDQLIKRFSSNIPEQDTLFRMRTDCRFAESIMYEEVSHDYFRLETDFIFSSTAKRFTSTLYDFYDAITGKYWNADGKHDDIRLNTNNLVMSKNRDSLKQSAYRWDWFNYDQHVIPSNNPTFTSVQHNLCKKGITSNPKYIGKTKVKQLFFSSERMFLYHLLEHCPVRHYETDRPRLLNNRKKWECLDI